MYTRVEKYVRGRAILFLLLPALFLFSCRKKEERIQGHWTGSFRAEYPGGTFYGSTTLFIENGSYTSASGPDRYPAGGSGKYQIKGQSIHFTDENFWTADFDWNLILDGKYTFQVSGKTLRLEKQELDARYIYELSKP